MNKQEFIQSIKNDHPEWTAQEIVSYANTPRTIPNPVTTIPKPIDFTALANNISPTDRVKIQNTLHGTYQSLLQNIDRGSLPDVANNIQNLIAGGLESATINVLQTAIAEVIAGIPNPVTHIYQPPYADYGLTPVMLSEVE